VARGVVVVAEAASDEARTANIQWPRIASDAMPFYPRMLASMRVVTPPPRRRSLRRHAAHLDPKLATEAVSHQSKRMRRLMVPCAEALAVM
jgi:hypothetical protein